MGSLSCQGPGDSEAEGRWNLLAGHAGQAFTRVLTVERPTAAHEVADQAFSCVVWGSEEYWPKFQGHTTQGSHKPHLKHRGQVTLPLVNGRKSADFSLADNTPGLPNVFAVFPTLVWEVAYTQPSRELAATCARWIACSLGRVLLAIGIDIVEKKLKKKTRMRKGDKKKSGKKPEY